MMSLRRLVGRQNSVLLVILLITTQVHSLGFISINCGLSLNTTYAESDGLTYVSDEKFIDTGFTSNTSSSYNISSYIFDKLKRYKEYQTVRYFPNGTRNCYTIRPLMVGLNYLIRATFNYGNYDSLNNPPIFEIYLGVNFWDTVNAISFSFSEIIINAAVDFLDVCLVNINVGTPFISSLHLRPFNTGMYSYVNSTKSLILGGRYNMGGGGFVRYPDDSYDRWWMNYSNSRFQNISSSSAVSIDTDFQTPPAVMQTAVTTSSIREPLSLSWGSNNRSTEYYVILSFYDVQTITGRREFNLWVNGLRSLPPFSLDGWGWMTFWRTGYSTYNISLVATPNSTLPPLLNALEIYITAPVGVSTYYDDVAAINGVKENHKIKKGWNGDPCFPKQFSWTSINCSTDFSSNNTRITSLNLSSSDLTGSLSSFVGKLTALQFMDLSMNDLSGYLPKFLDDLTALKFLDVTGNKNLYPDLPPQLRRKLKDKSLTYRFDGTSPSPPSHKKNVRIIAVAVVIPLLVIAVAIAVVLRLRSKKSRPLEVGESFPKFESRQFSYNDLKRITNGFKKSIGTGGFGSVYLGLLKDGAEVAVKMHSNSSSQGLKELMAEAESLSRVHHKNLVSLMGYCIEKNCMALVYEYMSEGNLYDKLKDNENPLSWMQRLQIAYESALGLEYLHKACNPPLIHRDVKTTNILLTANFEAKIADFGLSRTFNNTAISHVSTRVLGTPGYLDPEYYLSNGQLTVKSDVFSFGIVLLEIITGRPPTTTDPDGGNLLQWVREKLSGGDIEIIVDTRMEGKYDINSIWKVTNLACKYTELKTSERPTMTEVSADLKEGLELEISTEEIHHKNPDISVTCESQDSAIGMSYVDGIIAPGPSVR